MSEPQRHPPLELTPPTADERPARHRGAIAIGATVLIVIAIFAVWTMSSKRTASAAAETTRLSQAAKGGREVRTAVVVLSPTQRHLDLLGEAKPFATVTLYAKVGGYLKRVLVDVGDRVDSGAVLATIESPETDRALSSANADYQNKKAITDRVAQLLQKKLVSPQEADQARTEAAMASERLEGLKEQQAYETLRAPFAGNITARYADPGALVQSAATSQTSALPVVTVSATEKLRVFVYLDQADASAARAGTPALVTLTDRPDIRIQARIARVSGELDPKTRKMLAEVDIDNRGNTIVAGSFVLVQVELPRAAQPEAPAEALLIRAGKSYVGTVDADSRVHLVPVVVSENDGKMISFASGVSNGQRIALNLGSAVADGDHVRIVGESAR